jgi:N-acetylglucosaminyl-diphospho-decaprenol L-rhamnosyltransferase
MAGGPRARSVDVVVVAYNSARTLRACVEPLAGLPGVSVTVVDNASSDDSRSVIAGLPVDVVRMAENRGFAAGCNAGAAGGSAPYVLLLNPDARLGARGIDALAGVLDAEPRTALVGPRIEESDGSLNFSQRRFPRLRSTYAQALFLHRAWPLADWTDELVRDPTAYARPSWPDWVSGACMLVRRSALREIGGLDEDFFLYCEDTDLCARLRAAGHSVRYEPGATARHEGGASAPREQLLALHAHNRVLYARKHTPRPSTVGLEALGVALGHGTHALAALSSPERRRGHLHALSAAVRPGPERRAA